MYRVIFSVLLAVILSLIVTTGWFMAFNFQSLPYVAQSFVTIAKSAEYWTGVGIFSAIFFLFFSLPLSFLMLGTQ